MSSIAYRRRLVLKHRGAAAPCALIYMLRYATLHRAMLGYDSMSPIDTPGSIAHGNYQLISQPAGTAITEPFRSRCSYLYTFFLPFSHLPDRRGWLAANSPHDHDDEVEQIPAVPQVGVGVEEEAVGYHLEEGLHREDDEEQVLHALLGVGGEGRGGGE